MNQPIIFPLRPKQIEDVAFHMTHPKGGNLSDPAVGKTAPANVYMWHLWKEHGVKTIFLMPTSLFKQNYKSFFKFTHFEPDQIVIVRGTVNQRRKLMSNKRGVVFIASFGFFANGAGRKEKRDEFGRIIQEKKEGGPSVYSILRDCGHNPEALCVDEWHMGMKSMLAARTQALCWYVEHKLPIFIPMTGTAVDGHLHSVYPLIHALEPRYYLNYKDFLNQHAVYDFYGTRIEAWKNVEKVKEILQRHCIRHTFEETYGKDATVIEHQACEMSHAHREFYEEYESTAMMETPEGFREAAHGGEYVLRLRQICNCPEKFAEEWSVKEAESFELTKDERFRINISQALQTNKKFLVFAAFKQEHKRLAEIARDEGARIAILNGDVLQGKAREKIDDDMRSGKLDGVIASYDVVSVGYDWDFLDMIIDYSFDYKDSSFIQGYRRGVRGERKVPLLVYVMYYEESVEIDIMYIIEGKMKIANETDGTRKIFELIKRRNPKVNIGKDKPGEKLTLASMGLSGNK